MGDPRLRAVDLPMVAVATSARLERAKVGADVGFGEHCGRQNLTVRDLRQPFGLLRVGAAHRDQLACDLRPRAERRSEEHTSELQSLMRNSYAVFCLKKKN